MRFFELSSFKDIALYLFPSLIFVIAFWISLSFSHFHGKHSEERKTHIHQRFSEGIEGRDAPFPLIITLIIAGILVWGFFYTLATGLNGVKI